jgi:hypothetical protein
MYLDRFIPSTLNKRLWSRQRTLLTCEQHSAMKLAVVAVRAHLFSLEPGHAVSVTVLMLPSVCLGF